MSVLDEINQQKIQLRRRFLKQRQQLDSSNWNYYSQNICRNLSLMPEFQQARSILAFTSFRQEPDLSSLYCATDRSVTDTTSIASESHTKQSKQWGFSRCVGKDLVWHQYQPGFTWISGAYGIHEPASDWPYVNLSKVDLILVPAVACDRTGGRLGYGGGFYDRFLREIEQQAILTIGIIFSFAYCDRLPTQAWDRSLDFVCTEMTISPRMTA